MGEVYLARDRILNRNIALKLLPFDYTKDEERLRRFRREAQTASALNHPNILTIHEFGSVNNQQFIASELVEGETVRERIKRGQLGSRDALEISIQIAEALAAAHRAGVVHRDIKPENIMVRPDGYVKVLDFGLAKLEEPTDTDPLRKDSEFTDVSSAVLMGTVRYMSPEQASGLPVDARSDIFSVGVVLYEMIAGQPPFRDSDPAKLANSIVNDDPPALGSLLEVVPDGLERIVIKALSKDRQLRYQNADDLLGDLRLLKAELDPDLRNRTVTQIPHWEASSIWRGLDTETQDRTNTYRSGWTSRAMTAIGVVVALGVVSAIAYASFYFFRGVDSPPLRTGTWTTKAPISSSRWQAEPAVLNDILYVAGGWEVCTPFATLEAYDPKTDTWNQRSPMRTARGGHGVGVLNGRLYAVGGSVDCGVNVSNVEAYDPASDSWSDRAPLPAPRFGHSVAVTSGKLYAIGGEAGAGGDYLRLNTEYDPQTDTWTDRAPMPTARTGATAVVADGMIYVMGGVGSSGTLATVEAYDPVAQSWTPRRSMLNPRVSFGASEVNGIIYAFGGSGNRNDVEAYDPSDDTWTVVGEMPVRSAHFHAVTLAGSIYFAGGSDGVNYLSQVMQFTPARSATARCPELEVTHKAEMSSGRSNMAVGLIDGIIYVAGGFENASGYQATTAAYDPKSDSWSARASLPVPRETRGANNAVADGKFYVIGGNASGTCSNLNQAYDPLLDKWITRAPMPTPRCHLAVVTLGNLIYALGGTNTNGSIEYRTVEVYNPSTDSWTNAPDMPTGRQDLGAVSLNGILYALGGGNPALGGTLDIVEAFDPTSNSWVKKAPMPTARVAFATGILNGSLIVVGGRKDEMILANVEAYDPASDAWTSLANLPTARNFLSAVSLDDSLYLLGGNSGYANASLKSNDVLRLIPCSDQ
jgi:N-acetylneuraminic acid mutarotase